ncbi:MAG: cation diffusion facilitator family transporter [Candidatus Nanopelagicales bacterium]
MSTEGGTRAIIAALLANLGIAVAKFIGYVVSGSSSMLAESVHSLADCGNQVLLLIGGRRARRAATPEHPFGYGRERYVYAFLVSIILFTVGGMFSIYEGVHKLQHPEPLENYWVPIIVLLVAIGLESWSLRTAVRESNHIRGRQSWTQFVRHAKAPELPVVLLEDCAALLGLFFAMFGVVATVLTDDGIWDGVGTVCIGVLLICVAIILGIETKSLLLGEGASSVDNAAISAAILEGPEVERLIHMKTLYLGPDELLVAAKFAVLPQVSAGELTAAINAAEARIRAAVPVARVIYLEPDLYRAAAAVAAEPEGPHA